MGIEQDYMLMLYSSLFALWIAGASAFASFKPSGLEVDTASERTRRPEKGEVDGKKWCLSNCGFHCRQGGEDSGSFVCEFDEFRCVHIRRPDGECISRCEG